MPRDTCPIDELIPCAGPRPRPNSSCPNGSKKRPNQPTSQMHLKYFVAPILPSSSPHTTMRCRIRRRNYATVDLFASAPSPGRQLCMCCSLTFIAPTSAPGEACVGEAVNTAGEAFDGQFRPTRLAEPSSVACGEH